MKPTDLIEFSFTRLQIKEVIKSLKDKLQTLRKALRQTSYSTDPGRFSDLQERVIMIETLIRDLRKGIGELTEW